MQVEFLKFIESHQLCQRDDRVLLAVSGGIDSMVMAELFLRSGFEIGLAHLNYGLRGEESMRDEMIVRNFASENGLQIWVNRVDPSDFVDKGSIQMAAREIRYHFFEELARKHRFAKVATAHQLNDSLETVLLNLSKGTGINGLKGIPIINGQIIRPMLFASRDQIEAYANERNIIWGEDASNQKNVYQRNLLRNEVVPLLKRLNPSLLGTFEDTAQRLAGAALLVSQTKKDFLGQFARYDQQTLIIEVESLAGDLAGLVLLSEILGDYGFNFPQVRGIHQSILSKQSGGMFYADSYELNVDRNKLFVRKLSPVSDQQVLQIEEDERAAMAFGLKISIAKEPFIGVPKHSATHIAYFDAGALIYPLIFRKWKEGDRFTPLGMKGKKLVSDFMIDHKIPLTLKRDLLIMESGNTIAWLVDHRIADTFKVTPKTRQVLKITVEHV